MLGFFDSVTVTTEDSGGFLLGDVNGDGDVNGLDVDPFVDVLLNGPYQVTADMNEDGDVNGLDVDPFVEAVLGGGYDAPADMNGDGAVDGLDVDPFVAAVVGGGVAAVPEPSTLLLCIVALGVVGISLIPCDKVVG